MKLLLTIEILVGFYTVVLTDRFVLTGYFTSEVADSFSNEIRILDKKTNQIYII